MGGGRLTIAAARFFSCKMYITQTDLSGQISNAQLIQLTDDAKTGLVDTTKIDKAIAEAEAEVNGYVATKRSVPLASPIPDLVKQLCVDIAIYRLFHRRQRVPDDVRKSYEDAVAKLKDISKGLLTLGIDPPPAESSKAASGEVFGPERMFDRDKLGGF